MFLITLEVLGSLFRLLHLSEKLLGLLYLRLRLSSFVGLGFGLRVLPMQGTSHGGLVFVGQTRGVACFHLCPVEGPFPVDEQF
jgi:hypothetical protein